MVVSAKCRNKPWLQGLETRHFQKYVDFVLGDRCYNLQVTGPDLEKVALRPPWAIVLSYELEMCKHALKEARRNNTPLHEELEKATKNTELKELYFISPVVLARRRNATEEPFLKKPRTEPKGKGKGKDKGKTKSKKGKSNLVANAPDGKQICFSYNSPAGCSGSCGRLHVCRVKGCLKKHPAHLHDEKAEGGVAAS